MRVDENARQAPPAVGQVWQAWDVRSRPAGGGYVRIIEYTPGSNRVDCERVRRGVGGNGWERYALARVSLLVNRLRPTASGYRLIEDAPACTRGGWQ